MKQAEHRREREAELGERAMKLHELAHTQETKAEKPKKSKEPKK